MDETCEPSGSLAKDVNLGLEKLQEPCQVPRAVGVARAAALL